MDKSIALGAGLDLRRKLVALGSVCVVSIPWWLGLLWMLGLLG